VIFSMILITSIVPSYSDYISPKKQLESGVLNQDVVCRENLILVIRDSGGIACVQETTSQKLGWIIIKAEFLISSENNAESDIQNTSKINSQQERENYLNSLNFGLVSDESFEGELYGFDQNLHLRQPAPAPMSVFFAPNHYSINEDDLVGKNNLDHIIPQSLATTTSLETDDNGATIDYREWLPTYIAPGYYLKWVDITQPEDQYHSGSEGKGEIKFTYIPNTIDADDEITTDQFFDLNLYVVSVIIADNESTIYMRTSSQINEITRDGTATDIIYENKWDGYMQYVHASRSDPAKHGVTYDSPKISIASGGSALTMEQHENIVTELFERYSNR
jgi:hypothetical protein